MLPSTSKGDIIIIFLLNKSRFKIAALGSLRLLVIVTIKLYYAFNILLYNLQLCLESHPVNLVFSYNIFFVPFVIHGSWR